MESPTWFFVSAWFLTSLTLVGNAVLIYLICSRRQLHATPNWFVLLLAIADFGVGLSLIPVDTICTMSSLSCSWEFVAMTQWFFFYASVANLCTMTLDRYTAVVKPFQYVVFGQRRKLALLMSSGWVIPLTISFLPATFVFTRNADSGMKIYSIIPPLLFEIFPCLFLSFATCRILYIANRQAKQTAIMLNHLRPIDCSSRRSRRGSANGSVKAIATVVVIFLLCYSFTVYVTLRNFFISGPRLVVQDQLQPLSLLLNSSANPLAYGFIKNDIKREFKNLLSCRRKCF